MRSYLGSIGNSLSDGSSDWQHGKGKLEEARSMWQAAVLGDDGAILGLMDFYKENPPPINWYYTSIERIIDRIDQARRIVNQRRQSQVGKEGYVEPIAPVADTIREATGVGKRKATYDESTMRTVFDTATPLAGLSVFELPSRQ